MQLSLGFSASLSAALGHPSTLSLSFSLARSSVPPSESVLVVLGVVFAALLTILPRVLPVLIVSTFPFVSVF